MKIAICDDHKQMVAELERIVLLVQDYYCESFEIECFLTGEALLAHIEDEGAFDIVLLDIDLVTTTGIIVGDRIRYEFNDHTTKIIYVSAHTEYDRALFNLQPYNFIEKPFDEGR